METDSCDSSRLMETSQQIQNPFSLKPSASPQGLSPQGLSEDEETYFTQGVESLAGSGNERSPTSKTFGPSSVRPPGQWRNGPHFPGGGVRPQNRENFRPQNREKNLRQNRVPELWIVKKTAVFARVYGWGRHTTASIFRTCRSILLLNGAPQLP